MKNTLIAYAGALLLLIVADGLWLGLLMPQQYQAWIGPLMREQPCCCLRQRFTCFIRWG